jgi:hypothetical protein
VKDIREAALFCKSVDFFNTGIIDNFYAFALVADQMMVVGVIWICEFVP